MSERISSKVIHRLTLYHSILRDCTLRGAEFVSSHQMAELLDIDDSQVRKDINLCEVSGKTKIGYSVPELKRAIEKLLGFERNKDVFIIGAGNLGLALAKYDDFKDYGLNVLALFDVDSQKVDKIISSRRVFHSSRLKELTKKMGVEIAILTVPASEAQKVAQELVDAKIKYIWNFTPTVLDIPKNIKVRNENFMGAFLDFTRS